MNLTVKPYHHGNLADAILQRAAQTIAEEGLEALSLRGIARDLGVSHAAPNRHFKNKSALLTALAADAWGKLQQAVLGAADAVESDSAHRRLNAMGRGYLHWALNNKAMFRAIYHPDVGRYATPELTAAISRFSDVVKEAVLQTQAEGRHPNVPSHLLTIYTNAVPTGAALLMLDPLVSREFETSEEQEAVIAQVIDLVVPLDGLDD